MSNHGQHAADLNEKRRKGRYIDAFDVWENLVGSHDEEIFDQQAELVDIGIIVCVVG